MDSHHSLVHTDLTVLLIFSQKPFNTQGKWYQLSQNMLINKNIPANVTVTGNALSVMVY